jgi:hypothetical protein
MDSSALFLVVLPRRQQQTWRPRRPPGRGNTKVPAHSFRVVTRKCVSLAPAARSSISALQEGTRTSRGRGAGPVRVRSPAALLRRRFGRHREGLVRALLFRRVFLDRCFVPLTRSQPRKALRCCLHVAQCRRCTPPRVARSLAVPCSCAKGPALLFPLPVAGVVAWLRVDRTKGPPRRSRTSVYEIPEAGTARVPLRPWLDSRRPIAGAHLHVPPTPAIKHDRIPIIAYAFPVLCQHTVIIAYTFR